MLALTNELKNNIQLWCEALTSGKYQQGHCQLQDGDRFYCLGAMIVFFWFIINKT